MIARQKIAGLVGVLMALTVAGCASHASSPAAVPRSEAWAKTIAPEALAGYWLFEMKSGGKSIEGSLRFKVAAGVLAGSLTGSDGNERELSNLDLKSDKVSWDFEGPLGRQHAEGKIDGSSMTGTMKRAARSPRGRGTSGTDEPEPEEPPRGSGGGVGGSRGGGGRGGGGRGGRRGSGGSAGEVTWSAWKSALPPAEEAPAPSRIPSPAPGRP